MGGEDTGWEVGEVVLTSQPMAHVISSSHRAKICHQCWTCVEKGRGQMCGCGVIVYCGDLCRAEGGLEHESECGIDGLADLPDKLLLLLRIWLRLQEGEVKEEDVRSGRCRRWFDLEHHWQELEAEASHLLDILHKQLVAAVGEEVRRGTTLSRLAAFCLRWRLAGQTLVRSGAPCKPTASA